VLHLIGLLMVLGWVGSCEVAFYFYKLCEP